MVIEVEYFIAVKAASEQFRGGVRKVYTCQVVCRYADGVFDDTKADLNIRVLESG